MSNDRLPVYIEIDAAIKKLSEQGLTYYIPQKGDRNTGTILLKISDMRGRCKILSQMRDMDDKLSWFSVLGADIVDEREADQHINASKEIDPDQWIIEIEDPNMQNPFDV